MNFGCVTHRCSWRQTLKRANGHSSMTDWAAWVGTDLLNTVCPAEQHEYIDWFSVTMPSFKWQPAIAQQSRSWDWVCDPTVSLDGTASIFLSFNLIVTNESRVHACLKIKLMKSSLQDDQLFHVCNTFFPPPQVWYQTVGGRRVVASVVSPAGLC